MLLALFLVMACGDGDGDDAPRPDDAPPPDAAPGADGAEPGAVTCIDAPANLPSGMHNEGMDCMQCHGPAGAASNTWTAAGTVFTDLSADTPQPGATVTITDADQKVVEVVSARNGNFWTSEPLTYPLNVNVTCIASLTMTAAVQSPGSCNACHNTTDAAKAFPILGQ